MIDICTNCPLDDCDDTDARCGWRLYQQAERRRKASSRRQLQARRANIAIARHHRVEQAKLGFKKYDQRKRYAKRREVVNG